MPQRTTEYRYNTYSDQTRLRREKPVTKASTILGPVYPSTPSSQGPGIHARTSLDKLKYHLKRHSTCRLKLCTPPMSALWPILLHVEVSTDVQTMPFRARQSYRPTHATGEWLDPVQLSYERLGTVSPGRAHVSHRGLPHIFVDNIAQPQTNSIGVVLATGYWSFVSGAVGERCERRYKAVRKGWHKTKGGWTRLSSC